MSILNWGKCKLETTPSVNGAPAPSAQWKAIDTPKNGTTKIETTAGNEVEALEEGGGVVDVRTETNKYKLEFDLFVKKGVDPPFTDVDGVIAGEHAFRLTPEDEEAKGYLVDRATVSVTQSFTSTDGGLMHYVIKVLKPKTGAFLKPYKKA
jgi:hypothetical protein|nr:MAG TPA: hypothetical protein [Caudoviricetes sp.]